jgi:hypothetical protein
MVWVKAHYGTFGFTIKNFIIYIEGSMNIFIIYIGIIGPFCFVLTTLTLRLH